MALNPKCIVFKAMEQKQSLTVKDLNKLADTVPLAQYCIQCARRLGNKLEKFCWKPFA